MLKEAIEKLEALVCEGNAIEIVKIPGDPPHVHYVCQPNGELRRIDNEPPVRSIKLHTLADLIDLGKSHFDAAVAAAERITCFYSPDSVRLSIDHVAWREWAVLPLNFSEEYKWLWERVNSPGRTVGELRTDLRVTLRAAVTNERLVEQISALAVDLSTKAETRVAKDRESMGRSITTEIADAGNLPDEVQILNVRRWSNADLDMRMPCEVFVDPDKQRNQWFVRPILDSLTTFDDANMAVVGARLRDGFKGTPVRVFRATVA